MQGCLRIVAIGVVIAIAAMTFGTALSPGGIWNNAPIDFGGRGEDYCASGVALAAAQASGIESRGLISLRRDEDDAVLACAASQRGETRVVHVRAHCGDVLRCVRPLAIWNSHGDPLWVAEGVDVATLPGVTHPVSTGE